MASAAVSAPATVPALARTISIVSGFFFWGMIEEEEQYASSRMTNPTSGACPEDELVREPARGGHQDGAGREHLEERSPGPRPRPCEFSDGRRRSRGAAAVHSRSSGNPVEANAADPRGEWFTRA